MRHVGIAPVGIALAAALASVLAPGAGQAAAMDSDLRSGVQAYYAGDYAAALAQLRPLAEYADDPKAEYLVGTMYSDGQGVRRDPRTAARFFEAAARQDDAEAAFSLGFLLYYGAGEEGDPHAVPAQPAAAAQWFAEAAGQGNASAEYFLGHMFRTGEGAAQDMQAARHWLVAAANQGVVEAQFEAGLLFASQGGYDDAIEAYKWFDLAARAHYPGADENRRIVAERLNGPEIQHATDLANAWQPER